MPKVAKGRRKRAYGPKTSSGCLTCKGKGHAIRTMRPKVGSLVDDTVRRVKCDENHPACLRCTSTGRKCDGYHPLQPPPASLTRAPVTTTVGPSMDIHTCPLSRRSFAFFTQRSRPELAGFFGSEFWERHILQAAHHEPAIRYAIVAIGALHETRTVAGSVEQSFALEQYNLAIRSLLAPLSGSRHQAVDVCLIMCLLFTCFENMRGCHASADSHIRSGSKLLQELLCSQGGGAGGLQIESYDSKCLSNFYVPLEDLATIFAGLDTEAARTAMQVSSFKLYDRGSSCPSSETGPSLVFSSVGEAKRIFDYYRSLLYSSVGGSTNPLFVTMICSNAAHGPKLHFLGLMSKFMHALAVFVEARTLSMTPPEAIAMATLQLHVLNTYILLCMGSQNAASEPPNHHEGILQHMKELVRLSKSLIASLPLNEGCSAQTPSFCMDLGFTIPLFTVASKCPDMELRREAIALLRSRSRQEGLWNSLVVARAAERILEIEKFQCMPLVACSSTETGDPTVLQLDSSGVRLQYVRLGFGIDEDVDVVEEVTRW